MKKLRPARRSAPVAEKCWRTLRHLRPSGNAPRARGTAERGVCPLAAPTRPSAGLLSRPVRRPCSVRAQAPSPICVSAEVFAPGTPDRSGIGSARAAGTLASRATRLHPSDRSFGGGGGPGSFVSFLASGDATTRRSHARAGQADVKLTPAQ